MIFSKLFNITGKTRIVFFFNKVILFISLINVCIKIDKKDLENFYSNIIAQECIKKANNLPGGRISSVKREPAVGTITLV